MQLENPDAIAKKQMRNGYNCCQSVMIAAGQVFNIEISPDLLAAVSFFAQGMGSGCSCGALVGMVMFSGVIAQRYPQCLPAQRLSHKLHQEFLKLTGSACCRVIRKKQGFVETIGNRACIELTGQAAALLVQLWEEQLNGIDAGNLRHNSNAK